MTKDELRLALIKRLVPKLKAALTWADVASAITALSAAQKAALVEMVKRDDADGFARRVFVAVQSAVIAAATTQVDALLADDTLTVAELESLE